MLEIKVIKKCIPVSWMLLVLFKVSIAQEHEYTLNNPGNKCYYHYSIYAPNGNYNSEKRPFVFILGKEGEAASSIFERDTLKDHPQFFNYKFVYVPNLQEKGRDKLYCLEPLISLLTFHYYYGHKNIFLVIEDSTITQTEIDSAKLGKVFGAIRLFEGNNISDPGKNISIVEELKENIVAYENNQEDKDEEDFNTYYVESSKVEGLPDTEIIEKNDRTYFGKPYAFDFTLTGLIKDKLTGEALPYATVMVKGTNIGVPTNADGYFTLVKVPTDTNTLIVQYIGYNQKEIFLTPYTPKRNFIIEIKPSSQSLTGVTITAKKEDIVLVTKNEVSTYRMTPKKLENLPSLGEKDIMRSLQLLPGISASNESSSGLYVRGGTPDQNLILYDGFSVYHVDHLYGFYSAFNSNAIKDIRLYKGGFGANYGGRISSVTEITGKDGNQNIFNVGVDISLLSLNGFLEIPVGNKFTSMIAYRRSYKGLLYNSIFEKFNGTEEYEAPAAGQNGPGGGQTQETTVTNYFYDFNGKFTYHPGEKDIVSLSVFTSTDKLDNSSNLDAPSFGNSNMAFGMNTTDLTKYGNIGSSLKWSRKWSNVLFGTTILSYSNYYSKRDRSQLRTTLDADSNNFETKTGVFENNDLKDYSFKSDYQLDIFENAQFQFGVFGSLYDIAYNYSDNDTAYIIDKQNKAILSGAYLQSKFTLLEDKLSIVPGLRVNYFEPTQKIYYEPRLSASFKINSLITIKGATGKYYQFINKVTREDILSGSRDFWLLSDDNSIPVSSALHFDLGISWDNMEYLIGIEAYYKKIDQLTEYSLRFNTSPLGVNYDENFFNGNGFSKGIEFLLQKNSGKINGWVSYTLGTAKNHFDIYSQDYYPANQDVTHEFKIVGMYNYKRWDFSTTWVYATGRPYTAPSGAYTVTLLDGTEQEFFTVTEKNGLRLPAYHRMDISANYKILLGTKDEKKRRDIGYIGLSIFNIYNRQNVWYKEFTIDDSEIIETNVNFLGLVPNIILSLKLR